MQESPSQSPEPLVRTHLYLLAYLIGGVGGIGVWLGTELWHIAVGAPLVFIASALMWVARHGGPIFNMKNQSISTAQTSYSGLFPRSKLLFISSWAVVVCLVAGASLATVATGRFEQVFTSFGADLPALTLVFLKGRLLWWLFPAIALCLAILITKQSSYPKGVQGKFGWGLVALLLVFVITAAVAFMAMYQPIFNLGQVK